MGFEAHNETLIPSGELRIYVEVRKGRTLHTMLVDMKRIDDFGGLGVRVSILIF